MAVTRAESIEELTFELRDERCTFVAASAAANCTIVKETSITRSDDAMLEYVSVIEGSADAALAAIREHPSAGPARIVSDGDRCVIEVVLAEPCVAATLADVGVPVRSAVARDGVATVVADVPTTVDAGAVTEHVLATHPKTALVAKRTVDDRIPGLPETDRAVILAALTDQQRRVVETALAGGYFEQPRRNSAEECAAALDISQPTFSQHLRRAERKILERLFADADTGL